MSELHRGILLAHGAMADGIVDAVRHITGANEDALVPLSNKGLAAPGLADHIRARLGPGRTILFTDLQSGSCGVAARMLARDVPGLVVISGVNLPVLLDFVTHRDLPIDELVPRLLERGRSAIGCASTDLGSNDRPVSRG